MSQDWERAEIILRVKSILKTTCCSCGSTAVVLEEAEVTEGWVTCPTCGSSVVCKNSMVWN
jgi:transcription elongation factor Elf1